MNNNDELFFDIVNSKERREILQKGINTYTNDEQSINKPKLAYREQKNKKRNQVSRAIVAIALAGISLISATLATTVTKKAIDSNNAVVSITKETKNEIDEKIDYYENLMNGYSDAENRIETHLGRNENNELTVGYNSTNLAKHIINASQISEAEARCVIIAAFNIINEPYRDNVISSAFNTAKEQVTGYTSDLISNGTEQFLETLGYEDWENYRKNERKNIKELYTVEQYVSKGVNR